VNSKRATSSAALEWKKRVDRWCGTPLGILRGVLKRLTGRSVAPPAAPRTIVVAKLWGIGNLAMILPLIGAIRRRHPGARITVLTLERNRRLLAGQPGIDELVSLRDGGVVTPLLDVVRAIRRLRAAPVDLFIDCEQFLRTAGLVAWGAGARCVVGFDTPGQHRGGLYDVTVPCRGDRHMALGFAALFAAAGIPIDGVASHEVAIEPAAARAVAALLDPEPPRPWVVLHPGSGDNFPGRRWPVERFAELGRRIVETHGGSLFLTGAGAERELLLELEQRLAAEQVPARRLCDVLDLPRLVAFLARVDLLVANDTGPVHLAAAVRTPVVAFYGPNSPRLYGPLGDGHSTLYRPLPCSPCLTNQNGKSSRCELPLCIRRIDVDEAWQAVHSRLRARVPAPSCQPVPPLA
jgi:lipopolysaccharide heptosyltransferase II